ncbi:CDP-glucose 4,6-dehydratase [Parapusillimonas sp. JC17]|uniref:CDP-glucose 4,6-dehydratase n=1 Tax=Parapusillimonas sp. JC17 TaxID=3445768 RepID=UPI003F9F87E2
MVAAHTAAPHADFWHGKRVILTGHTGFKGSWLAIWLVRMGAQVTGLALAPNTTPSLYVEAGVGQTLDSQFCDIRDAARTAAIIRAAKPDVLFHLAAQPLVRASYRDPLGTYHTNTLGTAHILDALRDLDSIKVAVMVTTDKVYRSTDTSYPYRETDPLGGYDPYSASKAASEMVISSYRDAFLQSQGVAIASARAGNVIGGGDWSEDRLIPDAVRAWQTGAPLEIRRPDAIRPWQHVLEPLSGYLRLAEQLWRTPSLANAYNFGPAPHEAATVRDVIQLAQAAYGGGKAHFGNDKQGPHEAAWLALETTLTRQVLDHVPVWSLQQAVQYTMQWYRAQHEGRNSRQLCLMDIDHFTAQS